MSGASSLNNALFSGGMTGTAPNITLLTTLQVWTPSGAVSTGTAMLLNSHYGGARADINAVFMNVNAVALLVLRNDAGTGSSGMANGIAMAANRAARAT